MDVGVAFMSLLNKQKCIKVSSFYAYNMFTLLCAQLFNYVIWLLPHWVTTDRWGYLGVWIVMCCYCECDVPGNKTANAFKKYKK